MSMTFDKTAPDRRSVLLGSAALAAGLFAPRHVGAAPDEVQAAVPVADAQDLHGLSVFGDLKYAKGFQAFSYVERTAPKGGRFAFSAPSWAFNQNPQTFNSFNTFILKGDAPPRMELCFASLMVRALDEPDAMYGLVAESVSVSDGGNTYSFRLRPEARFHDESRLTSEDVAFSLTTLKEKGHPALRQALREVESVEAPDPLTVVVRFTGRQSRKAPLTIAGVPILSKAYYTRYDFGQTTLTPPLGSGPYKVGRHEVGRYVEYERVKTWWAADLPVSRGQFNFDVIRLEFFRDRQVDFEAFKKGVTTFREEFTSRTWATEYNFPAVEDGRVKREEIPDGRPSGAQGWFFNTRREKFSNPLIRQALGYCFDFEWSNQALFYGAYSRTQSIFQNSPMMAEGMPSDAQLALLEPFRARLSPAVFGPAITAPVSDGSGQDRRMLREADRLLREAGCTRKDGVMLLPSGEPLAFEILSNTTSFERVVLPMVTNLERLGIKATYRVVDPAQYQLRINTFDFDIVGRRFALSPTLGEEMRDLLGSVAARTEGSGNLAGIADPVVDALVEKALNATTREDMTVAAKALDRVLRAGHYWIPQWYKAVHTVAVWDRFGRPASPPTYDFVPETHWWSDPARAAAAGLE